MPTRGQLTPLTIAVLALLVEEPMHAYRMQQLMKERGVQLVVNVRNRSGLHAAIDRLARDELIRVHAVERDSRHPERTVYAVTDAGRDALLTGLKDSIAAPAQEFPLFPAVVSFLHLLDPQDARTQLERRAEALEQTLGATRAVLDASRTAHVPRLHLLEHEYLQDVTAAELSWVRGVVADLGNGSLDWPMPPTG
ncbi:PadR family transcriptional regulator [Kutzneria kofuensis]|uniref:DNA-binding PadR family transcriptional regulator n=1 Tax=Kutzneria kofuensis TaxID=103725 RepID=A0A7W9KSC3_9PSEU|nr:helix-turn-helix transcriptional regulator [Kutzneria kofuensis]MBB5897732.1 DNA-binding PadR family transcriptional regulator [Kutzneria kofuensis]